MNPLLEQFILEARDFLQGIGEKLMALEVAPDSDELMTELFRLVHTLKGNSGLFEFPEMTRVLHAGEDLMDAVRDRRVAYSQHLADRLLDAMDFVGLLLDEIENSGQISARHAGPSADLAQSLRTLLASADAAGTATTGKAPSTTASESVDTSPAATSPAPSPTALIVDVSGGLLAGADQAVLLDAWRRAAAGTPLFWIDYSPEDDSFFKGEDPFNQARKLPGFLWGKITARGPWPPLLEFDCYRCQLDFHMLAATDRAELEEYFRYTPEQVRIAPVQPLSLITLPDAKGIDAAAFALQATTLIQGAGPTALADIARTALAKTRPGRLATALAWILLLLEDPERNLLTVDHLLDALISDRAPNWETPAVATNPAPAALPEPTQVLPAAPASSLSDENRARIEHILDVQAEILALPDSDAWLAGRLNAVASTISACLRDLGQLRPDLNTVLADALAASRSRPLLEWLTTFRSALAAPVSTVADTTRPLATAPTASPHETPPTTSDNGGDSEVRFGRRAEDSQIGKVLKVEQVKIDRLMNLIGEMVVAKNSLPYLANRAENQFGVRELSRDIKAQYAVINRIAEEMQDAIMQVRMMPVSFVFQRFPRLVRDLSRKLGKEVELVLEGEETEADKNIVEALADPLIHIVRNSLDHGLEMPDVREAAGKPRTGHLLIRAVQESDRVQIEVTDDGRGIDPVVIKRKARERGLLDDAQAERMSDQDAINLVFAPGFSTAEAVSDLSGRGVGMDVVRNAIDRVGGSVELRSQVGQGTTLRLSLPLSMAVTNVMIIESDRQIFGVPMDTIVETVRLPRSTIHGIKRQKTTVLRGRIVPLVALNDLLAVPAEPMANADDELATLVVRVGGEQVGLLVDQFREVVDVILKPLPGELSRLSCYAGTALLGDGSVLMVLNPRELF